MTNLALIIHFRKVFGHDFMWGLIKASPSLRDSVRSVMRINNLNRYTVNEVSFSIFTGNVRSSNHMGLG